MRFGLFVAILGVLSVPIGAQADEEHPSATLRYERERGAERCPDEDELRDAVSARLGYVPFVEDAALAVHARIATDRAGLRATVEVLDASGAVVGERTIRSRTRDCEELARGLALAISVAIDPMSLMGAPAPEPEPTAPEPEPTAPEPEPTAPEPEPTAPEPEPTAPEPEPTAPPAPTSVTEPVAETPPVSPPVEGTTDAFAIRVALELVGAYGTVPSFRPGGGARIAIDHGRAGAELTFRGFAPGSETTSEGRVSAYVLDAHLLGCFVAAPLRACGGGYVGRLAGRGSDVSVPRRDAGMVAGLSLGAGYDRGFRADRVGLALRVGMDVPLLVGQLELDGARVWRGASVSPWGSIGVSLRIR